MNYKIFFNNLTSDLANSYSTISDQNTISADILMDSGSNLIIDKNNLVGGKIFSFNIERQFDAFDTYSNLTRIHLVRIEYQ